jgi:hypothetical protein
VQVLDTQPPHPQILSSWETVDVFYLKKLNTKKKNEEE